MDFTIIVCHTHYHTENRNILIVKYLHHNIQVYVVRQLDYLWVFSLVHCLFYKTMN